MVKIMGNDKTIVNHVAKESGEKRLSDIARDMANWLRNKTGLSKKVRKKDSGAKELSDLVASIQKCTHDNEFRKELEDGINLYATGKEPGLYSKEDLAIRELNSLANQYFTLDRSKDAFNNLFYKVISPMCMKKGPVTDEFYPSGEPYAISAVRYRKGDRHNGLNDISFINFVCNEEYQKEKGICLKNSLLYSVLGTALLTTGVALGLEYPAHIKNFYEHMLFGYKQMKSLNHTIPPLVTLLSVGGLGLGLKGYVNYLRHKRYDSRVPTLALENLRKELKNGKRS